MNNDRTSLFYMANLGSEFSRALSDYQKKDFEKMQNSLIRAKNIIMKIENFPEMKGRTGEIEILKSILENLSQKKFELDKNQLIDYFNPFAIRYLQKLNLSNKSL
ncbi:MAG: hypothetical protein V1910_01945 [bacterium]